MSMIRDAHPEPHEPHWLIKVRLRPRHRTYPSPWQWVSWRYSTGSAFKDNALRYTRRHATAARDALADEFPTHEFRVVRGTRQPRGKR